MRDCAVLKDIILPRALLARPDQVGGTDHGDMLRGDLHILNGKVQRLEAAPYTLTPRTVIPALIEAHCHLDKCHSIGRLGSIGGDLHAAITAQRQDKQNWTADDLHARATRGLTEARAAGCRIVRTHVDWGDSAEAPLSWRVLTDLACETGDIAVQCAALTGIDQWADVAFSRKIARVIARDAGVSGAFVLSHSDTQAGLKNIFAAADTLGLALDFHVDEGLGAHNGLEAICDMAIATGFQGSILCGHAVSLMDRNPDDLARIIEKLLRCEITICALPSTNLYLQDRTHGTPDRRGLTRMRELQNAGVPIVIGSDNVGDAFCPVGHHDPMAALHLALLTGHLDPPFGRWLCSITTSAAKALGFASHFIDTLPVTDLQIAHVSNLAELIARRAPIIPLKSAMEPISR